MVLTWDFYVSAFLLAVFLLIIGFDLLNLYFGFPGKTSRYKQRTFAPLAFCFGWFFIGLLTVSNIVPNAIIQAERYLYFPSFGPIMLLGMGVAYLVKIKRYKVYGFTIVSALVLVVMFIYQTYQRNNIYRDDQSLWTDTLNKSPRSLVALNNLALAYEVEGLYPEAEALYKRALLFALEKPDKVNITSNLAEVYYKKGQYELAEQELLKVSEIYPRHFVHYNLGLIYEKQAKFDLAKQRFEKALEIRKEFVPAKMKLWNLKKD